MAALSLLHGGALRAFIITGILVEVLGFTLVARAHIPASERRA